MNATRLSLLISLYEIWLVICHMEQADNCHHIREHHIYSGHQPLATDALQSEGGTWESVTILAKPEVFSRLSSSVKGWHDECLQRLLNPLLATRFLGPDSVPCGSFQAHTHVYFWCPHTDLVLAQFKELKSDAVRTSAHFLMLQHEHICCPHWPSEANITRIKSPGVCYRSEPLLWVSSWYRLCI